MLQSFELNKKKKNLSQFTPNPQDIINRKKQTHLPSVSVLLHSQTHFPSHTPFQTHTVINLPAHVHLRRRRSSPSFFAAALHHQFSQLSIFFLLRNPLIFQSAFRFLTSVYLGALSLSRRSLSLSALHFDQHCFTLHCISTQGTECSWS